MAEHWQDLIALDQIVAGDVTEVHHDSRVLAVFDTHDGVCVSDARCTHAGANLCDGYFDGKTIECPLHQGLFDARTGQAKAAPATRPLNMLRTRIHNGMVQIAV